jgi:uncharacterized protein (DUF2267 family)
VQEKIVMEGVVDPIRFTQGVLFVASGFVSPGELDKIRDIMPKDLQTLWQPPAN